METYNFWADLLASYRASPDLIKALWLLVPLVVAAGLFALMAGAALRLAARRAHPRDGEREIGRRWLASAAPPPLIEHARADEVHRGGGVAHPPMR